MSVLDKFKIAVATLKILTINMMFNLVFHHSLQESQDAVDQL
jgi:hypothetical protein